MSSTQRGNHSKKRAQKHKNITKFINNKYDTTDKLKQINQLVVSNVCQRCKDCIEWKIKYKKYKALTIPAKCVKCQLKKIKYAYHIVCSDCSVSLKICAKCTFEKKVVGSVEKSATEKQREESVLREELKFMRLREKRTFLRQLGKGEEGKINKNDDRGEEDDDEHEDESEGEAESDVEDEDDLENEPEEKELEPKEKELEPKE